MFDARNVCTQKGCRNLPEIAGDCRRLLGDVLCTKCMYSKGLPEYAGECWRLPHGVVCHESLLLDRIAGMCQ